MEITKELIASVIRKLILPGENHRREIVNYINKNFLDFAFSFFQEVVGAKMRDEEINVDWYKKTMMNEMLPPDDIAINAGINKKTIGNVYGNARRATVIDAAHKNYEHVKELIEDLINAGDGVDLTLTIKFKKASVELNVSESLIVINALAIKRAALQGGAWGQIGKRAEKPLMLALCHLYSVDSKNYDVKQKKEDGKAGYKREIDFFIVNGKIRHKCEIKLIGKGNTESIDSVFAREGRVFVADNLTKNNIKQLNDKKIEFIHLKSEVGYRGFATVLKNLQIPHKDYKGNLEKDIDKIVKKAMAEAAE